MKTIDVFFRDTNFVGRELENVQDLVKALAAGMDIANIDGCGYCTYGEKEVVDEEGNTKYEEYEKSEQELFEEMKSDLENGLNVYAGFFLDYKENSIVPASAINLQSNFYIGQEVYTMKNNKVIKAAIRRLWLTQGGETYFKDTDYLVGDIVREMRNCVTTLSANKATLDFIGSRIDNCKAMEENMAYLVNKKNFYKLVKLSEVFATKEELVKHLMMED